MTSVRVYVSVRAKTEKTRLLIEVELTWWACALFDFSQISLEFNPTSSCILLPTVDGSKQYFVFLGRTV